MNAQEAIERVEWTIEQHKQMQMFFADKSDVKQVRRYESLEKDVKALAIVLESAKENETIKSINSGHVYELKEFLKNPDSYFSKHYPHIPLGFYDSVKAAISVMERQEGADE